jgi:hypothetical protein
MLINIEGTLKTRTKDVAVQTKNGAKMKCTFTLETNEEYPQRLQIELFGERTKLLDGLHSEDYVKVQADLRGRDWTGKDGATRNFLSLAALKIEKVDLGAQQKEEVDESDFGAITEKPEDLPF